MASFFVADEALVVPHVLSSFTRREIDFIHVHCIRITRSGGSGVLSWWDVAISSSLEFPELYHVSVKLSCFVKPLFPFPTCLFLPVWEDGSSHHDSKLLDYPSLEGIHKDAIIIYPAVHLGQLEGGGVFVKVSIKLVHVKGVNSLAGLIFDVLWNESLFEGFV